MPSLLAKNIELNIAEILGPLLLSIAMGLLICWIYRRTHSGLNYTRSFSYALLALPFIIAIIMMAIGSSIALSLGLVGSLSILRFRTAIKDVRDMIFIFIAIAMGLTCGSGNIKLGTIGLTLFGCLTFAFYRLDLFNKDMEDYFLTVRFSHADPNTDLFANILNQYCKNWTPKSIIQSDDQELHWSASLILKKGSQVEQLIAEIKKQIEGTLEIRVIAPDSTVVA